ncbi:MAG: IS21 family transposase [Armatimonadetes bacterium]|nr:IS21 family transposase [Armatimonadota bacterium]
MERLRVQIILDIIYRLRAGQSERAIGRDLGYARDTVRRYAKWAKKSGYMDSGSSLPELENLQVELPPPVRKSNISTVEPYCDVVKTLLEQGVEMITIHKRLVRNHGYTGSYTSVRRFVSHLLPDDNSAVVRIETPPGQEAQVDFGGAGKMRDPKTGKFRQAYCFVMTLSFSRHQYVEFVFDQKIKTWIGCHRRAFESFGGVPKEVVVDNLKAAVIKASLDDPILCEPYRKMAHHYGILIHPCRVRTPEHKGKVENGVHYVQRNCLAGQEFMDIDDANREALRWVSEDAGLRTHGTTREQPLQRFYGTEQAALLPLPVEHFELFEVRQAKVHRDCHVEINAAYYSAPFKYVGEKLEVYVFERVVQIYDGLNLVVTHERATRKGQRITRIEHYPPEKSIYLTRPREYCRQRAYSVGPRCGEVVSALLENRPLDNLRSVQGIIGLAEKYGEKRMENACARALHYGDPRYKRIKDILKSGMDMQSTEHIQQELNLRFYEFARTSSDFFEPDLSVVNVEVEPC